MDRSEAYNSDAHAAFSALDPPIPVLGDTDEWGAWDAVGDPVLHIQVWLDTCEKGRRMLSWLTNISLAWSLSYGMHRFFNLFLVGVGRRAVHAAVGCNVATRSHQLRGSLLTRCRIVCLDVAWFPSRVRATAFDGFAPTSSEIGPTCCSWRRCPPTPWPSWPTACAITSW